MSLLSLSRERDEVPIGADALDTYLKTSLDAINYNSIESLNFIEYVIGERGGGTFLVECLSRTALHTLLGRAIPSYTSNFTRGSARGWKSSCAFSHGHRLSA
ncbi:hypothetical protein TNCV_4183771 [Trichonephila clavipes]|nr:hypothetical protein TNCV_4183771 [Trichonephila clavipes]